MEDFIESITAGDGFAFGSSIPKQLPSRIEAPEMRSRPLRKPPFDGGKGLHRFLPVFGFGVLSLFLVTWWNLRGPTYEGCGVSERAAAEGKAQQRRAYIRHVLASTAAAIIIVALTVAIVSAQLPLDRLAEPQEENGRRDRTEDSGRGRGGGG